MEAMKKNIETILILYNDCRFHEVSTAAALVSRSGSIKVVSPDGEPIITAEGLKIAADCGYQDLDWSRELALVLPGGECSGIYGDERLSTTLQLAAERKCLIAGICNGVLLMARAGILEGKKCTHTCTDRYAARDEFSELLSEADKVFANSWYCDEDVVVDSGIITAKPWAFIDFGVAIAAALGALSRDEVEDERFYLRGDNRRSYPALSNSRRDS